MNRTSGNFVVARVSGGVATPVVTAFLGTTYKQTGFISVVLTVNATTISAEVCVFVANTFPTGFVRSFVVVA